MSANKITENHPIEAQSCRLFFFNYRFDLPKTAHISVSASFSKEVQLNWQIALQLACD